MDLHELPSVDQVISRLPELLDQFPRALLVAEVRRALESMRDEIRSGGAPASQSINERVERSLRQLNSPSLRRVINATGVILHTNLGRAPLPAPSAVPGYCNLEFDVVKGRRGKRDVHSAALLERLLGYSSIAVNNNAAAVYLVLHELAAGREVIVSRGELIEIGDGFRIPDIMSHSGAVIREVGTTNRTSIEDYREAISDRTGLILRVHPSNFRIEGFTARPGLMELAGLGREKGLPVYEDLGSGCLVDLKQYGVDEPLVIESLKNGADLVSFSGDKLLGGPQAGIIAGNPELVSRLRQNPMFRALRLDKLVYQALETVLREILLQRYDSIPVLRMIMEPAGRIRERAEKLLAKVPGLQAELIGGESLLGGGSTPGQSIPTCLIAISGAGVSTMETLLRSGEPPIIARVEKDRLLLDLRTVQPDEEETLLTALQALS